MGAAGSRKFYVICSCLSFMKAQRICSMGIKERKDMSRLEFLNLWTQQACPLFYNFEQD